VAITTDLSCLAAALEIERGEMVSLVGGGGKTTSLFALGAQLSGTTILTTTTKMGSEQVGDIPLLVDPNDDELTTAMAASRQVLTWKAKEGHRAVGVEPTVCDRWFDLADNVVVEADGSRKRPFKAPSDYEPVIPSRTTMLAACIGVSAFGQPIAEGCHRPEILANLVGASLSDDLTPAVAAKVLRDPQGSQKFRPTGARFAVLLHRVTPDDASLVDELADQLGDIRLVAVRDSGLA